MHMPEFTAEVSLGNTGERYLALKPTQVEQHGVILNFATATAGFIAFAFLFRLMEFHSATTGSFVFPMGHVLPDIVGTVKESSLLVPYTWRPNQRRALCVVFIE